MSVNEIIGYVKDRINAMKSKGMATVFIMIAIFATCAGSAFLANKYLPRAAAEKIDGVLEDIAEHEAEEMLHLPDGGLKPEMDALFNKEA